MSDRAKASAALGADGVEPIREGLCDSLWRATRQLHAEAERTGFVNDVLRQRASLPRYLVFLRNLLPVYEALEQALQTQGLAAESISRPQVFRASALRADLAALHGADWERVLPVLPAGVAYAQSVVACSQRNGGIGLAGHAYTRYLGDLNGGQILARLLAKGLDVPESGLSFYAFPGPLEPRALTASYRAQLDAFGTGLGDISGIVEEAKASFTHSIALSLAVAAM